MLDLAEKNMGIRMKRSAFFIDNSVLKYVAVDEAGFKDTSAEEVFAKIWFKPLINFIIKIQFIFN